MTWYEALILGLVQGLTEYLPVSSSGHLAIGSTLFGIDSEVNLSFTIVVHIATVFSTLVILWKEVSWLFKGLFRFKMNDETRYIINIIVSIIPVGIVGKEVSWLFKGLFRFKMNDETRYIINIIVSMIPVGIVGVFFKDYVEAIFGSGLLIVGLMLLLTALLLTFSYYARPRQKEKISLKDAFIIGVAQACAVMPGLSRSGSTIATGLLLGNKKENMAQFSFLMVIPPILGEALLDIIKMISGSGDSIANDLPISTLIIGFLAAFISGCIACKWMINLVKRGKLIYFAIYCVAAAAFCILYYYLS